MSGMTVRHVPGSAAEILPGIEMNNMTLVSAQWRPRLWFWAQNSVNFVGYRALCHSSWRNIVKYKLFLHRFGEMCAELRARGLRGQMQQTGGNESRSLRRDTVNIETELS